MSPLRHLSSAPQSEVKPNAFPDPQTAIQGTELPYQLRYLHCVVFYHDHYSVSSSSSFSERITFHSSSLPLNFCKRLDHCKSFSSMNFHYVLKFELEVSQTCFQRESLFLFFRSSGSVWTCRVTIRWQYTPSSYHQVLQDLFCGSILDYKWITTMCSWFFRTKLSWIYGTLKTLSLALSLLKHLQPPLPCSRIAWILLLLPSWKVLMNSSTIEFDFFAEAIKQIDWLFNLLIVAVVR